MRMKLEAGKIFSIEQDNPPVEGCTISETLAEEKDRHITVFSLADGTSISAEFYASPTLYVMAGGSMEMYESRVHHVESDESDKRSDTNHAELAMNDAELAANKAEVPVVDQEGVASRKDSAADSAVDKDELAMGKGKEGSAGNPAISGTNRTWQLRSGDIIITPPDIPIGIRNVNHAVYTEIGLGREAAEKEEKMNGVKSDEVFALKDLVPYQEGKIVNRDIVDNEHLKFVVMSFDKGTGLPEHAAPGEAIIFALDGEGVVGYDGKEYEIKAGQNFKFDKGGAHYVKAVKGQFKMALLLTLD